MIGTVLIHDRQPLEPLVGRAALGDVDDAGVEVAVFAGYALVYGVGDDVRDPPPVGGRRKISEAGELLFGEHIPQPELDLQPAVVGSDDTSVDQRRRVEYAPVGEARQRVHRRLLLHERARIERPEQPGPFQVGGDHRGHLLAGTCHLRIAALERHDRDRQRLDDTSGDVDAQFRCRRRQRCQQQQQTDEEANGKAAQRRSRYRRRRHVPAISRGLKISVIVRHRSNLSGGNLNGWQRGFKTARRALSAVA